MLVQALQYQNAACERGTAGRRTKSIAPRLWFCVVSVRGWGPEPPTACWRQDSLTHFNYLTGRKRNCSFDNNVNVWNSVTVIQPANHISQPLFGYKSMKCEVIWTKKKVWPWVMRWEYQKATLVTAERGESQNWVSITGKACLNDFYGIWELGKRWRCCLKTTCDLLHIRNFMKHQERYGWQCRRRERQIERSSKYTVQQLDRRGPRSFKQTYRDLLGLYPALVMSLNGSRWLQKGFFPAWKEETYQWKKIVSLEL